MTNTTHPRPDYGIDAPGAIRAMFAAGAFQLALMLGAIFSPWPGGMWSAAIAALAALAAADFLGVACYLLYLSKSGKVRGRERLLDLLPWSGNEAVLDVGCGRGLLLVAAAKRVPAGRATGIDIWRAEDQQGSRPEAALENARLEGVAERVAVETADMRQLPFPDASFDVVLSHWAVHNVPSVDGRSQALGEMARVLRPGGHVLLADIEHRAAYLARFVDLGFEDVRQVMSPWAFVPAVLTLGHFRPAVAVARKPSRRRQANAADQEG
jgi:ubiquinone/menaquinone biosynthesis C-methylase UbiE